jgi:hypothetical protein
VLDGFRTRVNRVKSEVRLPINHWTLKMRNVVYSLVILFCSYIFLKISAQELFQNLFLTVNFSSLELKYRTHHSCSIVGLWFSFIQDFPQKHFHINQIMTQSNFQVAYELILTTQCFANLFMTGSVYIFLKLK